MKLVPKLGRAQRVLAAVLVANLAVAGTKISVGIVANSAAVRADGFHSVVDAGANVFGLVALSFALRPPDESHAYGHRKAESLASFAIVVMLALLIVEIVRDAVVRLQTGATPDISGLVFIAMGATIGVNTLVAFAERWAGQRYASDFLIADSQQTTADIAVSASVLVSLGLSAANVPYADVGASLLVALVVAYVGYRIVRRGADVLLDRAVIADEDIDQVIYQTQGVESWHKVRTRGRSDEIFIDLHIKVDPDITVREGHEVAHHVQNAIRAAIPTVADVTVHVEPAAERKPASAEPTRR